MAVTTSFLEGSVFFDGLPAALAEGLVSLARPVALPADATLFEAGDPGDGFYGLLAGQLKVVLLSADGDEQLLAVLKPGAIVGELTLADGEPRSATVTALSDCRLAFVERAAFARYADAHPAIYRHMLAVVGARLRHANDALAARAFLPLAGRVAQILMQLSADFGRPLDGGRTLIHTRVSQTEIANMAGAARETASRALNELMRAGTISRISGYYCIERPEALRAAAAL